jgi:DNA primase large subunit
MISSDKIEEIDSLLTKTQKSLADETYSSALSNNFSMSGSLYEKSVALINKCSEGVTLELAKEIRDHIRNCDLKVEGFSATRMIFTSVLRTITGIFTASENRISSTNNGSVNAVLRQTFCNFARTFNQEIEKKVLEADVTLADNIEAINKTEDIDEATRQELIAAEREKINLRKAELRDMLFPCEIGIEVTDKEGYLVLFNQWWNEAGRFLDRNKLDSTFNTMIQYAKQKARRGIRIEHEAVSYCMDPTIK